MGPRRRGVTGPEPTPTPRRAAGPPETVPLGVAQQLGVQLLADARALPAQVARRQRDVPAVRAGHQARVAAAQQRARRGVARQLQAGQDPGLSRRGPRRGRPGPRRLRAPRSHAARPGLRRAR